MSTGEIKQLGNNIANRQNEGKFVQRIAAFRRLYTEYKTQTFWWSILVLLIAILGTGFVAFTDTLNSYILLASVIIIFVELGLLDRFETKRDAAALIRELFDRELFELSWNAAMVSKPTEDIVSAPAARFWQKANSREQARTRDWYEGVDSQMTLQEARLFCQKQNLGWSEGDQQAFLGLLWVLLGLVFFVIIAVSLFVNLPLQTIFNGPILLLIPAFVYLTKQIRERRKARTKLARLQHVASLYQKDIEANQSGDAQITQNAHDLQNEIYHYRCVSPQIPDRFYEWRTRRKNETP